jgi:hypothetical protein
MLFEYLFEIGLCGSLSFDTTARGIGQVLNALVFGSNRTIRVILRPGSGLSILLALSFLVKKTEKGRVFGSPHFFKSRPPFNADFNEFKE